MSKAEKILIGIGIARLVIAVIALFKKREKPPMRSAAFTALFYLRGKSAYQTDCLFICLNYNPAKIFRQ